MSKRMLIDALHPQETRVVIEDDGRVEDCDFATASKRQIKGNVYLAKVTRVEPSLQAAFVEYGGGKQGFLPFSEIHPSYYQIPLSDRIKLIEEMDADDDGEDHGHDTDDAEDAAAQTETETPSDADAADEANSQPLTNEDEALRDVVQSWQLPEQVNANAELDEEEDKGAQARQEAQEADVSDEAEEVGDDEWEPQTIENGEVSGDDEEADEDDANATSADEDSETKESDSKAAAKDGDDEEERPRRRKPIHRRYRIQEVIKRGQIVLVQVIKEERGNKGVSLSTYISLAGRYCVLMPNSTKGGGISRKIANNEHRRRLREMLDEIQPDRSTGMSVIIRTAGIDRSRVEIRRDYDYLVKLWNQIREDTLNATAPALIYEEGDLIKRSIRDMYTSDIEEVWVAGDDAYRHAKDFMKLFMPSHATRVQPYKEAAPILHHYAVEDQLANMYDPTARLPSGGYLVINPTEALIAIDVNSGRSTGERNIEETAKKTNLEAAEEVARQLRMRDLAGLIVIDFIDMLEHRNRRAVERALKDALKADRAKIQIGRISPFGLLEMSRQRLRPSIAESIHVPCPHCEGRGHMRSPNTVSLQIIRDLQREASLGTATEYRVLTSSDVALYFLNEFREALTDLQQAHNVQISIVVSERASPDGYTLERLGDVNKEAVEQLKKEIRKQQQASRRRSRGGRKARSRRGNKNDEATEQDNAKQADEKAESQEGADKEAVDGEEGDQEKRPRRRRRSRGGRRRRGRDERRKRRDDQDGEGASENGEKKAGNEEGSVASFAPDSPAPSSQEYRADVKPVMSFAPSPASSKRELTKDSSDEPKKKGWWRRVIEG